MLLSKRMKCEVCQEEAFVRFSPDLDIDGLGACEKHKDDVDMAYIILITSGKEEYEKFIKSLKRRESQPIKPNNK